MTNDEMIEHAKGEMVVQVRLSSEVRLLNRVFPVSGSILEEHDGKYHVDYDSLGSSGTEVGIVVTPCELPHVSLPDISIGNNCELPKT